MALVFVAGWLLGVASGLLYVAVTGGWYEYRILSGGIRGREMVNSEGWHVVPGQQEFTYLRRPRFRLP